MLQSKGVTGKEFIKCVNGTGDETTHSALFGVTPEDSQKIYNELSKMLSAYTIRKLGATHASPTPQSSISISVISSSSVLHASPSPSPPPPSDLVVLSPPFKAEGVPLFSPSVVTPDLISGIRTCQPKSDNGGPLFSTEENRSVAGKKVKFYYVVSDPPEVEVPSDINYTVPTNASQSQFFIGGASPLFSIKTTKPK